MVSKYSVLYRTIGKVSTVLYKTVGKYLVFSTEQLVSI